jgi:hypothetical protein
MESYPGRPMVLGAADAAQFFFRRLLELLDLNTIEAGEHLQHFRTKLFKTEMKEHVVPIRTAWNLANRPWGSNRIPN